MRVWKLLKELKQEEKCHLCFEATLQTTAGSFVLHEVMDCLSSSGTHCCAASLRLWGHSPTFWVPLCLLVLCVLNWPRLWIRNCLAVMRMIVFISPSRHRGTCQGIRICLLFFIRTFLSAISVNQTGAHEMCYTRRQHMSIKVVLISLTSVILNNPQKNYYELIQIIWAGCRINWTKANLAFTFSPFPSLGIFPCFVLNTNCSRFLSRSYFSSLSHTVLVI